MPVLLRCGCSIEGQPAVSAAAAHERHRDRWLCREHGLQFRETSEPKLRAAQEQERERRSQA